MPETMKAPAHLRYGSTISTPNSNLPAATRHHSHAACSALTQESGNFSGYQHKAAWLKTDYLHLHSVEEVHDHIYGITVSWHHGRETGCFLDS